MSNMRPAKQLVKDAMAIWQAGVDAVRGERLVERAVRVEGDVLHVEDHVFELDPVRRLIVVGAGKAGADMAVGLEKALGKRLLAEKQVTGWVNVPEGCERKTKAIRLHAARPQGVNEPTAAGVQGTREILDLVGSATRDDLCIALVSGGASAMLPAPVDGISLADKLAVTRFLSAAGANIRELNTVRKQLSTIQGGGLARACNAGQLVSLIISDVPGDPLDVIASGPTAKDTSTAGDALEILDRYGAKSAGVAEAIFDCLNRSVERQSAPVGCRVTNVVIGNNALAVDAAGLEAERRGYSFSMRSAREPEGLAEDVGRHLADMALRMRTVSGPDCLITGGEPVVQLVDEANRGKGGRNQQLVLAAMERLARQSIDDGIAMISGGTDGEDGPTDAAGAILRPGMIAAAAERGLSIGEHLSRNDAYRFFEPLDGLVITGPTQTNVCDLRVAVVDRIQPQPAK